MKVRYQLFVLPLLAALIGSLFETVSPMWKIVVALHAFFGILSIEVGLVVAIPRLPELQKNLGLRLRDSTGYLLIFGVCAGSAVFNFAFCNGKNFSPAVHIFSAILSYFAVWVVSAIVTDNYKVSRGYLFIRDKRVSDQHCFLKRIPIFVRTNFQLVKTSFTLKIPLNLTMIGESSDEPLKGVATFNSVQVNLELVSGYGYHNEHNVDVLARILELIEYCLQQGYEGEKVSKLGEASGVQGSFTIGHIQVKFTSGTDVEFVCATI